MQRDDELHQGQVAIDWAVVFQAQGAYEAAADACEEGVELAQKGGEEKIVVDAILPHSPAGYTPAW